MYRSARMAKLFFDFKSRRRLLAFFAALLSFSILTMYAGTPAYATQSVPDETGASESPGSTEDAGNSQGTFEIVSSAESMLVLSTSRGKVLYDRNAGVTANIPAASKIMTAVIALEALTADTLVTISKDAEELDDKSDSPLYIIKGEKCSVQYLVAAMIYRDSDAAALSLAEYISNDEASFVKRMNETAKSLNMKDTLFANTSGEPVITALPSTSASVKYSSYARQYTTLNDLALLFRYALNQDSFRGIFSRYRSLTFQSDGTPQSITNTLVSAWGISHLDGAARFSGTDSDPVSSVVSLASADDFEIVILLSGVANDSIYQELSSGISSVFNYYEVSNLVNAGDRYRTVSVDGIPKPIDAVFKSTVRYIHPIGTEYALTDTLFTPTQALALPINAGDLLGQVSFTLEDGTQIVTEVVSSETLLSESSVFSDTLSLLKTNHNLTVIIAIAVVLFLISTVWTLSRFILRFHRSPKK